MLRPSVVLILSLSGAPALAEELDCSRTAMTQLEINDCLKSQADTAQAKLDRLLRELKSTLSPKQIASLDASQKSWEQVRALDCEVEGAFFEGGTIKPAIIVGCWQSHTDERIRQLRFWLCPDYEGTGEECAAARQYR